MEITGYSEYDKAKILYNHLYFNNLDIEMIDEIFHNKNYWKIIRHKNYNPRLIEYFTKEQNINHLTPKNYFDFILNSLERPEEIWESALANQLNVFEKYLLFILLTFGKLVLKTNLEYSYEAKIEYEVTKHGFTREINIFNISLRNLMDGYIKSTIINHLSTERYIDFVNPSLRDFLILFFNRNNTEKWKLIESLIFVEQFDNVFKNRNESGNNIIIDDSEIRKYIEIIYSKKLLSTDTKENSNILIRKVRLIYSYKNMENVNYIYDIIINLLNEIDWTKISISFVGDTLKILEQVDKNTSVFNLLLDKWEIIVKKLVNNTYHEFILSQIKNLFNKFGFDYNDYIANNDMFKKEMICAINRVFEDEADDIINQKIGEVYSDEEFNEMEQRVSDRFNELSYTYLDKISIEQNYFPCNDIDVESLINDNQKAASNAGSYNDDLKYDDNNDNIENMVDNLFSTFER